MMHARIRRNLACCVITAAMCTFSAADPLEATRVAEFIPHDAPVDQRGPVVHVKLITGGEVSGTLRRVAEQSVVLDCDGFPCAFCYNRMLGDSAYRTKLEALAWQRGGHDRLTAADRFGLGLFALRHGRYAIARRDLARAGRRDPQYRESGRRALSDFRVSRRLGQPISKPDGAGVAAPQVNEDNGAAIGFAAPPDVRDSNTVQTDPSRRARIIEGYKDVGRRIRERVGRDLVLLETPHFLIWTDWLRSEHADLRRWCEDMYTTLAKRFCLSTDGCVFAGKCPLFALRSRKRFQAVAELLDGYEAGGALGYTSSDTNGHVHVVIYRHGGSPAARDAFASTLVHEGTHAFLHRYHSTRHIPSWINEGLADFVAQSVLGDQCSNQDAADAVAAEIVAGEHSIAPVFASNGALDARYYPVAHSLVSFLIEREPAAFISMIDDLKDGAPVAEALMGRYHMTLQGLEQAWRRAHGQP